MHNRTCSVEAFVLAIMFMLMFSDDVPAELIVVPSQACMHAFNVSHAYQHCKQCAQNKDQQANVQQAKRQR